MSTPILVAAVQAAPVFLDREGTIDKVCDLLAQAGDQGAGLVVFPEAFVPGYPDWVWRTPAWRDGPLYRRLWEHAVELGDAATRRLGEAAAAAAAWVAIGVNERDTASATLYNTLLDLGPDGSLAGSHRKLVPTGGERTVWGTGDGSTLTVVDAGFARVGGLICWENYMPLARTAMYAQGVEIYLAPTWDNSDTWVATLRHIAREARVYVIGINTCLQARDIPQGRSAPRPTVGRPGRLALARQYRHRWTRWRGPRRPPARATGHPLRRGRHRGAVPRPGSCSTTFKPASRPSGPASSRWSSSPTTWSTPPNSRSFARSATSTSTSSSHRPAPPSRSGGSSAMTCSSRKKGRGDRLVPAHDRNSVDVKVAPSPELAQTPVSATLVHRAGMCSLPADRRRWAGYSAGGRRVSLRRPDVEAAVLGYHEVFHLLVIAGVAAHFLATSLLALLTGWTRPVVDRAAEGAAYGCWSARRGSASASMTRYGHPGT